MMSRFASGVIPVGERRLPTANESSTYKKKRHLKKELDGLDFNNILTASSEVVCDRHIEYLITKGGLQRPRRPCTLRPMRQSSEQDTREEREEGRESQEEESDEYEESEGLSIEGESDDG